MGLIDPGSGKEADHEEVYRRIDKRIDKRFLEAQYGQTRYEGLRLLAVDEIAVRRGHRYMTVVRPTPLEDRNRWADRIDGMLVRPDS